MRRLKFLTRDDLRFMKISMRCQWLDIRWVSSNAQRRADTGDAVLTKLSLLLDILDGGPTPYIADPENRMVLQHTIGMLSSRVSLDLGRPQEAMKYASEFNRRFQQILNLAEREGRIADNPKLFEELTKHNKDRYDEVTAAQQSGDRS
jgi:hypothetical protein